MRIADSLVLAFIYGVIQVVVVVVVGAILAGLAFLTFGASFWQAILEGQWENVNVPMLIVAGLVVGVLGAALQAIFITWQSAAFTLAYHTFMARMTPEKQPEPELKPYP